MTKFRTLLIFIVAAVALTLAVQAQEAKSETKSEVPELTAMHDIIYPIWHTAYPEKDVKALRSYVPQVDELAAKIYSAKLPGILRDKQAKWDEGLAKLRKSVDDYKAAAAGTNDEALLKAAENLHTSYEALVRTIRPVLPEVDAFHQVLYVVNHTYAPEKSYDKIREISADLLAKAEALGKVTLPARLQAKAPDYAKASADLIEAAKQLDAAAKGHDHQGMLDGVDRVHVKYQALEKIFD
jgi:hypothetical protein